jgi:glutathione S-transferase
MSVYIYGPQFSNFVRSLQWVCEEKGIAYDIGFAPGGRAVEFKGAEHGQWHPYHKIPVLLHEGRALVETAAICRYLDENFAGPKLSPADAQARADVDSWCQLTSLYIDKAIVRDFLLELVFPKGEDGKPRAEVLEAAKPAAQAAVQIMADKLAGAPYFGGESPSLLDAIAAPILCYVAGLKGPYALLPEASALFAYAARMQARPSGQKVFVAKG